MQQNSKPFDPLSLAYRPDNNASKKKRIKLSAKQKVFGMLIGVVLLSVIGVWGFVYYQYQKTHNTPDKIAQREAEKQAADQKKKNDDMLATAKEEITLPTNEQPILATVSNRNALQDQSFFKIAQNGDRILMYPKNKKIFLYRPSLKQVLAQAVLKYTVGQTDPTSSVAGVQATLTATPAPIAPK